jgi:trypsin-like peptidase
MRYWHLMVWVFVMLAEVSALGAEAEPLYEQLSRAVVRLEGGRMVEKDGQMVLERVPVGTAFFVRTKPDLYVVSARHVVDIPYDLVARVPAKHNGTGKIEVLWLELPHEKWVYHPESGDEETNCVDLAAMKIPWIRDRSVRYFRYEPTDSNDHDANQFPLIDPQPPEPVLVFGFPADIGFALVEQRPLARLGIVAMNTGRKFLKVRGKYVDERCSLVDCRLFGGNSGSPVLNQLGVSSEQPRVLGVTIASNAAYDYGVMEPVSRIRETLDVARGGERSGDWKLIMEEQPAPGEKP